MKKLLALSMALVMALAMTSMATAATAAYVIDTTGYRLTDGVVDDSGSKTVAAGDNVTPGWTVYYQMFMADGTTGLTDADQVKSASIKQTWDMGKEYIESVSIAKKKLDSDSTYYYFVEVKFKSSTSTSIEDFSGEISVKKSTTTTSGGVTTGEPFEATLDVSGTYAFPYATGIDDIAAESTKLYNFGSSYLIWKASRPSSSSPAITST
jgi:hypothetical protein